ncbi:PKD domain-containing protein [Candidatus Bipolaricaulota bacterium]
MGICTFSCLGDGTMLSGEQCKREYEDSGASTVTLTIKDNGGARSSASKTIGILNPSPLPGRTLCVPVGADVPCLGRMARRFLRV